MTYEGEKTDRELIAASPMPHQNRSEGMNSILRAICERENLDLERDRKKHGETWLVKQGSEQLLTVTVARAPGNPVGTTSLHKLKTPELYVARLAKEVSDRYDATGRPAWEMELVHRRLQDRLACVEV